MKAAICTRYGPPEVLTITDFSTPVCGKAEVLIKIMASSVNSGDVRVRALVASGMTKLIMRVVLGFTKPRKPVLGVAFAGIVDQVGQEVTNYRPGDKVFGITGFRFGTHAEYVCVKASSVMTTMPAHASFEEAAALPFGWHTAIYFLQKAKIDTHPTPRVLIYGATGSVGAAAVQLAQHYGASITAVCSSQGKALLATLGIEDVICYDQQDFTQTAGRYDIIFDAVGKTSNKACKPLLAKGGRFVTVGGMDVASEKISHLELVRGLYENGQCLATIDRTYPFEEIVAAHRYVDTGRKKGDVVLTFSATTA